MPEQETAGRQPEWALMDAPHDALRRDLGAAAHPPQNDGKQQSEAVRELYAGWTSPKWAIHSRIVGRERAALSPGTLARLGPS